MSVAVDESGPAIGRMTQESRITLRLLHPTQGHVVHRWSFQSRPTIRIGRADENEVTVEDPSVSRRHAELRYTDGEWELCNLGRNGTTMGGKRVTHVRLKTAETFRLGPTGPLFEFREGGAMLTGPESLDATTISKTVDLESALVVDEQRRDADLRQIVDSPFFRRLQQDAVRLRQRRARTTKTDD